MQWRFNANHRTETPLTPPAFIDLLCLARGATDYAESASSSLSDSFWPDDSSQLTGLLGDANLAEQPGVFKGSIPDLVVTP